MLMLIAAIVLFFLALLLAIDLGYDARCLETEEIGQAHVAWALILLAILSAASLAAFVIWGTL